MRENILFSLKYALNGIFSPTLTPVKSIILESKSEICKWFIVRNTFLFHFKANLGFLGKSCSNTILPFPETVLKKKFKDIPRIFAREDTNIHLVHQVYISIYLTSWLVIDSNGGGHLSEMTTQKSEKKWTFERKKNNPKEQNLKNQMDIWAKEK